MTGHENSRTLSLTLRTLLAALLFAVAIPCVALGIFLPFDLAEQARTDRLYYAQFRDAVAQVERTGQPPERAPPGIPEGRSIYPVWRADMGCDPSFRKRASDRFVLSFWRGEWMECYAFPSGETTLRMSLLDQMRGSPGQLFVGLWVLALAAIWGAVRLARGLRTAIPA